MTQHRAQPTRLRVCLVGPALLAAGALLAGCSGTNIGATISPSPTAISGTVSLWHYWTDREAKLVQQRIDAFTAAHPGVKVDVHPAQDDLKLSQVMAAGSSDVDVAWLASPLQLGTLCPSGTFMNLQPYVDRDHVDLALFTQVARTSTTFNDVRCSMPTLADTYGLYFNKTLLNAAGITTPPKTLDDLENVALKLTTYNDDGSIKTLGFNPLMGFYQNKAEAYAPLFGGTWMTNGKSSLNQASWIKFMNWQKSLSTRSAIRNSRHLRLDLVTNSRQIMPSRADKWP